MNRTELFALFDNAADGVHIVAEDQQIIYWNSAAKRLLGYEPVEALGHSCFDLVAGGDYQGHSFCRRFCPTIRAVAQGKGLPPYDVKSQTKAGRDIWLNISVIPMQDPEADGNLAVHLFRDVSKRRQAEMLAQQTIATVSEFRGSDGADIIDSQPAPTPPLTRRELEVLRLLACGARDAEISEALGIKHTTVRNHVEHILGKLGVHSRLQAVVFAAQHRLV